MVLVFATFGYTQEIIDQISAEFEHETSLPSTDWKYSTAKLPNAFQTNFDDSAWKTLTLNEKITPDSAWLRKTIVLPQQMLGKSFEEGGTVKLILAIDDAGICWIDGEKKGKFDRVGEFELTTAAKPGQTFVIAIKAINTGGPMRILTTRLEWEKVRSNVELIEDYIMSLKIGRKLLSDDTYLQVGRFKRDDGIDLSSVAKERRLELRKQLEEAARMIDFVALKNGDFDVFTNSFEQSREALKPIGDFAKEFTLILDSNAHIDCAWLWRYLVTINIAKNTFKSVLDMMEACPDFTYTESQAHLYWWIENMFPDLDKRIKDRVKDWRWELIGGMWIEPDCNLISGESWARQLLYGMRYFKEKFGVDVKIGWNPDSFGYNWNMPQFYRDAGIDAFITQKIGWNDTNMFPYSLFWWQAPDSSKMLTYFPYNYVDDFKNRFEMVDWLRQFEANTGFPKMLILYSIGDHAGGPTPEMLDRIENLKRLDIYPKVEYGTATEYLDWIRSHDLSSLPVWNDELYLEYHRGTYTSQSNTKKYNRECEIRFGNAEQLATIATLYGRPYPNKDFVAGWRGVMFNQFHNILSGSSIYPVYKDSDELYEQSLEIARHHDDKALKHISEQVNTKVKKNARPLFIYNPLAWERSGLVEIQVPANNRLVYAVHNREGKKIPLQVLPASRYFNKILFIAQNIPAMGYAIYELRPAADLCSETQLKTSPTTLENEFYRLTVDTTTGWLSGIYDRKNNREALAGPGNELQLFKDTPKNWDAWNIGLGERFALTFRSVKLIETGPVRAVLRVEHDFLKPGVVKSYPTPNNPNSYFTQDIILYSGLERIDFVTNVDWWEEHVMLKVAFDVNAEDTVATHEIPFGTIKRPTTNKSDRDKARFETSQQKWTDLTNADNEYGVSLLNRSKYGGDIHGSVMRISLLRSPKWPDPEADMGKHSIEYALYPHIKCWKSANTMRKAYEYNYPLIAQIVEQHKGDLPKSHSFVAVDAPNVILHTVKSAEPPQSFSDSPKQQKNIWILRLFEVNGRQTEVNITLPQKVKKAVLSNFLEEDGEALKVSGKSVKMKLPGFRVATVKVWF